MMVAICDDDKTHCENLRLEIAEVHPEYECNLFYKGEELLEGIGREELIFLDIEMPGYSGMRIARELRSRGYRGEIIFLTSHSEFMSEAFEVRAFRYLQKPVERERLCAVFDELEKEWGRIRKVIIDEFGIETVLNVEDIVYIQAEDRSVSVHTRDRVYESTKTIRAWEEELGKTDFYRIHKSCLISLAYVGKVLPNVVILTEEVVELPLSRRKSKGFREALYSYIREHARMM